MTIVSSYMNVSKNNICLILTDTDYLIFRPISDIGPIIGASLLPVHAEHNDANTMSGCNIEVLHAINFTLGTAYLLVLRVTRFYCITYIVL